MGVVLSLILNVTCISDIAADTGDFVLFISIDKAPRYKSPR